MRTTITLNDELFEAAAACCDPSASPSMIISKACETLVEIEAAKRLIRLSGKAPGFKVPDRSQRESTVQNVAESQEGYGMDET
jgi:hypothetical protein